MKAHILLVEDNEGDILLTTEALQESKTNYIISVAKNGRVALDFVFKRGTFSQVNSPDLILLDVNLPFKNGHEVLEIIKRDESTKHIPVIMLTTSSSEKDIFRSYRQYANCYITKPVDVDDFFKAISIIEDFWLSLVMLPSKV